MLAIISSVWPQEHWNFPFLGTFPFFGSYLCWQLGHVTSPSGTGPRHCQTISHDGQSKIVKGTIFFCLVALGTCTRTICWQFGHGTLVCERSLRLRGLGGSGA